MECQNLHGNIPARVAQSGIESFRHYTCANFKVTSVKYNVVEIYTKQMETVH